jgi:hypothetical protein
MDERLHEELASFTGLWKGGYFEGMPDDPMAKSKTGLLDFMSVMYVTYLRCIKPYVNPSTIALEIGPGRGTWTRVLLPCREVWCLDALPAEHNGFFSFLNDPQHVRYFQVTDFECRMLPSDHFDYVFSYGCLCHVSLVGIGAYARSLLPKVKQGANLFWMIADYDKYNEALGALDRLDVFVHLSSSIPLNRILRGYILRGYRKWRNLVKPRRLERDLDDEPRPGRWYHAGLRRTCEMLEREGYAILDEDVGTNYTSPIIHFTKP